MGPIVEILGLVGTFIEQLLEILQNLLNALFAGLFQVDL